jgi:selenocysteine lyase/cysteine desulfurase
MMKNNTYNLADQRRSFIKKSLAGFLGLMSFPGLAEAASHSDFSKIIAGKSDDEIFALVRKQLLLDKDIVYMNTGSLGPSPRMVVDKVNEAVHQLERNPVTENWGPLGKEMEAVREKAAKFINADVNEIILTRNTTEGLSLVGSTLKLNKGDEILTTNHEHGGGEVGLKYMAEKNSVELVKIEMPLPAKSKEQIINLIKDSITPNTKVLLLSHVVTITGMRMPIKEIANITRKNGILFMVDGAQAPGMLAIDIKKLGVDVYATSGHKWLMGPKETGIVYLRKDIQNRINPVFLASGNASYSASSGTRNVANFIGLGETFAWHEIIDKNKIEDRVLELSAYCRELLTEVNGLEIISPTDKSLASAMVSVRLLGTKNQDIYNAMKTNNIIIKLLPKYNALRFSMHMFNTREDIKKLVGQLNTLLNQSD